MTQGPILISGAGIAGLTAAFWLARSGLRVVIVEQAPSLRAEGHAVDLWGSAVAIAAQMGIKERLLNAATQNSIGTLIARGGWRTRISLGSFSADIHSDHIEVMRSTLIDALASASGDRIEIRYGVQVETITQQDKICDVTLSNGERLRPLAVIGADGLHSRVRTLVFGRALNFEQALGGRLALWTMPNRLKLQGRILRYLAPDRTMVAYPVPGGDDLAVIALYRKPGPSVKSGADSWRAEVIALFGHDADPVRDLLAGLGDGDQGFADEISMIEMSAWHRGRVVLIGDAGFGPGAALGGGTGLAILSAYLLAARIIRNGVGRGLAAYTEDMRPLVAASQQVGPAMMKALIPRSNFGIGATLAVTAVLARLPAWLRRKLPLVPRRARDGLREIAHFPLPNCPANIEGDMRVREDDQHILWDMEKAFWLEGVEAYRRDMAGDAVMLFPAPAGIMQGAAILDALAEAPRWQEVEMADSRLTRHSDSVATLVYKAQAVRDDAQYQAFCSSAYLLAEGEWKLIQHQQTPISEA